MARQTVAVVPVEATEEDAMAIIDLSQEAFGPDPLTEFCHHRVEPPPNQREQRVARAMKRFHNPQFAYRKAVDPAHPDGPMLGFAVWYWSVDPQSEGPDDPFGPDEPGTHTECLDATMGKLRRWRAQHFAERNQPFLFMCGLAVRPDCQRRGIGSALLREGLAEADRRGQPAFVEATPAGLAVYRKFGWEDTVTATVNLRDFGGDDIECTVVGLVRPPAAEEKAGV